MAVSILARKRIGTITNFYVTPTNKTRVFNWQAVTLHWHWYGLTFLILTFFSRVFTQVPLQVAYWA